MGAAHVSTPLALGIDVGNAKLKLCVASDAPERDVRWISRPLPYDDRARYRRHADFERGVPAVLEELLGSTIANVRVAVAVTSSGYAYPTYREGLMHTMALLSQLLPEAECFALSHEGALLPAPEVARGDRAQLAPALITNGMGAAHLARRIEWLGTPANGIVVDTGGTTSQVATFVDGAIDPGALADRERYLEQRLTSRRSIWIGTQTTPLEALASAVPIGGRSLPVLPRGVTFDAVTSALELAEPDLARKLSLFGLAPSRADALRAIADSVNLDGDMATDAELIELARHYHDLAIGRLASDLRVALETVPEHARQKALVFGLGATWLTVPALVRAGVPIAGIAAGTRYLRREHAEIASCYGACHLALERLARRELPVQLDDAEPA